MPVVISSAIDRIEWDHGTLYIWFHKKNKPYDYPDVPESVYKAFLKSRSKGVFYNNHIKDKY